MDRNVHNDCILSALLDRARRYCALSEQCEDTVRQKLVVWGATPSESDAIVDRLHSENYLDDERYAQAFCQSKIMKQHWGRQKVLYHLRLRHLARSAVDSGMAAVSDEDYRAALCAAAQKKLNELHASSAEDPDVRQKLTAFLLSRGFTLQEINQSLTNNLEL